VSTAKYFAPELLGRFLKAHPGVAVKLEVDNREAMIGLLAGNEVDLAVMGRPPQNMATVAEGFAPHPHVIIAPPDHPLAGQRRIPLERLAEETFVIREPGSGTRGLLERLFAEHKLPLKVSMEMASNETIKQAVIAGMGISFLSAHTISMELRVRSLVVLDVQGFPLMLNWFVVHRENKRLPPVALAFKRFLMDDGAALIEKITRVTPGRGGSAGSGVRGRPAR
jgi:DNA-binding transcriptional LysR family regulator